MADINEETCQKLADLLNDRSLDSETRVREMVWAIRCDPQSMEAQHSEKWAVTYLSMLLATYTESVIKRITGRM